SLRPSLAECYVFGADLDCPAAREALEAPEDEGPDIIEGLYLAAVPDDLVALFNVSSQLRGQDPGAPVDAT
ncbi:MAG: hypothetical protein ACYCVM_02040, partial [Acidiferrobacter sp.]